MILLHRRYLQLYEGWKRSTHVFMEQDLYLPAQQVVETTDDM